MNANEYAHALDSHKNRVHTHAMWLTRNADDAVDATQEAFMRLWQRRKCIAPAAARAWLVRTVHRVCLDRLKSHARREINGEQTAFLAAAAHDDPTDRGETMSELRNTIGRALSALPPRDRGIILMREFHAMTYEQISRSLDLPMGTVKAALHRARERLRRELVAMGVAR